MRLFGYYALHSFVNQLRKIFKTWVLVFILVCGLLGGLLGFGAAKLEELASEPEEEIVQEEEETAWEMSISAPELTELIAGGVLLGLFFFEAFSADTGGSKIFLPADVNLLFASPMKPQSVLMFRLAAQMGRAIALTLYLMFQLPNLVLNVGLSWTAAGALLLAWFAAVLIGRFLQVLLYILCAANPGGKTWLRRSLYGLALVIGCGFLLSARGTEDWLASANAWFNGSYSRFIPIWGWLKAVPGYAMEGNYLGMVLSLALTALGGAGMVWFIWHREVDFYEDAMAKSEEMADLMEKARSEKSSGVAATRQRKKEREDTLRRDGLNRGWGASVFFHKTLYNRFRFGHLHFFTKTMETYLAAAVGGGALLRFAAEVRSPLPIVLGLGVMVFFRAMGNPLEEDTSMDFFRLIPEPAWKKMFCSALGGLCNTFLDLLLPMLGAAAVLGVNPLELLVWLPVILSVDFYASSVASFIDLSVPASIGKVLKQLIQIMFIYFGLLPDIAILAIAIVLEHTVLGALGATAVNLFLGVLFFFLAASFLEPGGKEVHITAAVDRKAAKKDFSRIGFAMVILVTVTSGLQILLGNLGSLWFPALMDSSWGLWLLTFVPQYLVAMPLAWLLLRRVPARKPEVRPFGAKRTVTAVFACLFLMYGGNLLGSLITAVLGLLRGAAVENPVLEYAQGSFQTLLFVVLLAPMLEELVFRKLLIDRMAPYGGKLAVVLSALLFGLFHGNLSQFFYAFGLGLAFGYIYLNTGRIRNTILAHMCINFQGMIFAPWLLSRLPETEEVNGWVIAFGGYTLLLIASALVGAVLLFVQRRNFRYPQGEKELSRKEAFALSLGNPGMILGILSCLGLFALSLAV